MKPTIESLDQIVQQINERVNILRGELTVRTTPSNRWQGALGKFAGFGFALREPDDHVVELYFKCKRIAVFNQTKVTKEILREGCQNYWNNTIGVL